MKTTTNSTILLTAAVILMILSQQSIAQDKIVATYSVSGKKVYIDYFIFADTDDKYDVSIALKRDDDPSMIWFPENLNGDVGEGIEAGKRKTIVWEMTEQEYKIIKQMDADDFRFHLTAEPKSGGISSWYYYGAAATATVGAAILLLSGGSSENEQIESSNGLPDTAPGRP